MINLTKEEIEIALNELQKRFGHNVLLSVGFQAGIDFVMDEIKNRELPTQVHVKGVKSWLADMDAVEITDNDQPLQLTKLEHFSGLAMQGYCTDIDLTYAEIAENSVNVAKALMAELAKDEKQV